MRLKLDENLPASLVAPLIASGHDVSTVPAQCLGGAPDERVAAACAAEDRVLLTLDRGFGDPRRHPPGTHAGIVVLRTRDQSAPALLCVVRRLVALFAEEDPRGRLWIVDERRVRIRE